MKKIAVIGAGIVGLSTAYKLLQKYPGIQVQIIEKEKDVSMHQTGHNSGVIHSGIYYTPGSLKAKNCRNGYHQLIEFCNQNDIEYELCGKLIVATEETEIPILKNLFERGKQNQLKGLKWLNNSAELKEYEPYVEGIKGIWVPQTGIIDYKKVSKKLKEIILKKGGIFHFEEKVKKIKTGKKPIIITGKNSFSADYVINCAGLYSDKIAQSTSFVSYKIIPFRGEYYVLKPGKEFLVKNLIYPVPDPSFPFLGVHFTKKLTGGVEAGPNAVLAFGRESYKKKQIHPTELMETLFYPGFIKVASKYWKEGWQEIKRSYSKKLFTRSLQKLIPQIREEDLVPGGSGIRAQAVDRNGNLIDDFLVIKEKNILHIGNAPSPAATASLSIADYIVSQIGI